MPHQIPRGRQDGVRSVHREIPQWARKKVSSKNNPRENMRRKTASEINTKRVDAKNRLILKTSTRSSSAAARPKKGEFNMEVLLSPQYKETKRSPGVTRTKPFPRTVLDVEARVGGPEPRYPTYTSPDRAHRKFYQQSAEESKADYDAATKAAAASCKSKQVLAVEPLPDHLFSNEFLKLNMSELPLTAYDAPELFERASPQEWLALSEGRGFSLYQHRTSEPAQWTPCAVTGYDATTQKFSIRFESGLQKKVHRLRLRFEGEDRSLFEQRLAFCKARQLADMQHLRWRHFLKSQSRDQIQPIRKRFVMQILRRSHYDADSHSRHRTRSLIQEIQEIFAQDAMAVYCRQMFQRDQEWASKQQRLGLPSWPPPPPPKQFGKLASGAPKNAFRRARKFIDANLIYNQKLPSALLRWLQDRRCARMQEGMCLFAVDKLQAVSTGTTTRSLSSFNQAQEQHTKTMSEFFSLRWRNTIINRIIDSLQSHYNLLEPSLEAYRDSPLERLLRSFNFRLTGELSDLLESSLERLLGVFSSQDEQPRFDVTFEIAATAIRGTTAEEVAEAQRRVDFADGEEETRQAQQELAQVQQKHSAAIGFSPSCQEFEDLFLNTISESCALLRAQHTIEPKVATLLELPEDNPLLDVGTGNAEFSRVDNMVDAFRQRIVAAIRRCFQAPSQFIARFEPFLHVFDVDPSKFAAQQLANFDAGMLKIPVDHPIALKQRIHPAIRAILEATMAFNRIPDELSKVSFNEEFLGMFKVKCGALKESIAGQANAIVDAVCAAVRVLTQLVAADSSCSLLFTTL